MTTKRAWVEGIALFLLLFIGFNLLDHARTLLNPAELSHWYDKWGLVKMTFYWGVYGTAILALVVALCSRSRLVRWTGLTVVFVFTAAELTYQGINGYGIDFFEALVALEQVSYGSEALQAYRSEILTGVGGGLLIALALYLITRLMRLRLRPAWLVLVPVAFLLTYAVIWRTHAGTAQFPPPFKVPLLTTYAAQSPLLEERAAVELDPPEAPAARHVVFIIDESIRGDFLSVNGFPKETTPFLARVRDRIVNLGVASSAANCSQVTNIILQSGTRQDQLPDTDQVCLTQPNLFQYAKAAGYTTYFLEGQYDPGTLPPLMRDSDLEAVDVFFQVDKRDSLRSGYNTDYTLARKIEEILQTEEHAFILVNKKGAHFHYESHYPPHRKVFRPTLQSLREAVEKREVGSFLAEVDRMRMINSYSNIIRWSVDGFFETLLTSVDLSQSALVYTSDHGQSFKEGTTTLTHCVTEAPPTSNAAVPLLVMGGHALPFFEGHPEELVNGATHFQLFPSLLRFMGYEASAVQDRYGVPLWRPYPDQRHFISGDLFGRGSNTRLNAFRPEQIQLYPEVTGAPVRRIHDGQ